MILNNLNIFSKFEDVFKHLKIFSKFEAWAPYTINTELSFRLKILGCLDVQGDSIRATGP